LAGNRIQATGNIPGKVPIIFNFKYSIFIIKSSLNVQYRITNNQYPICVVRAIRGSSSFQDRAMERGKRQAIFIIKYSFLNFNSIAFSPASFIT